MTLDDLSEVTGMSISGIKQVEYGTRRLSMKALFLFMNVFGCDANTILGIHSDNRETIDDRLNSLDPSRKTYFTETFNFMLDREAQMAG